MPESICKMPQGESPVARAGAGDISERELSRERQYNSQTPTARVHSAHPKKQLFSVPVSKFTGKSCAPSPHLARLRSCLMEARAAATPTRPARVRPKAISMEDLTPTKKIRISRQNTELYTVRSPGKKTLAEEQAADKIARFMLVSAWRCRRHELRCVRKTLECQVLCSERLRIQVSTLKALLDSDNCKLRLALRELERLKQLLRDKELEKAVLEREKVALERDVCAAEDQASEMSIGWRNSRNELEGARAAALAGERALAQERAAAAEARAQRDHAYRRLSIMEEELSQHEAHLSEAEAAVLVLRREADDKQAQLARAADLLRRETQARERCARECAARGAAAAQAEELRGAVARLHARLADVGAELDAARARLDWWPRSLSRLAGAARSWLRRPLSVPVLLWALAPARPCC